MLASTVQFSTNNQTPTEPPRQPPATRAVRDTAGPAEKNQHTPQGRPVPSGPNSAPTTNHPPHTLRSTPPPQGQQYWEPAGREPAELVSVPPSSTTQATRARSVMSGHRCPGMALD